MTVEHRTLMSNTDKDNIKMKASISESAVSLMYGVEFAIFLEVLTSVCSEPDEYMTKAMERECRKPCSKEIKKTVIEWMVYFPFLETHEFLEFLSFASLMFGAQTLPEIDYCKVRNFSCFDSITICFNHEFKDGVISGMLSALEWNIDKQIKLD